VTGCGRTAFVTVDGIGFATDDRARRNSAEQRRGAVVEAAAVRELGAVADRVEYRTG
jgi:hypothetical protein